MKERPIIFSGPMVRAILDGRKTQTRRIVKPQPLAVAAPFHPEPRGGNRWVWMARDDAPGYSYATADFRCPCGAPGDRLWVRETWAVSHAVDHMRPSELPKSSDIVYYPGTQSIGGLMRRPSIHMPRWASRITLEIVSVRVEMLWDSINAKRAPWSSNPWVWVIEFRRAGE